MPCKSNSFTFQKHTFQNYSDSSTRSNSSNCRKRLKDRFDESEVKQSGLNEHQSKNDVQSDGRRVLSVINLNDTRRYFRNGAERLSRTFNSVRVTIETISQRFKLSTKRRQILEEGPMTPNARTPFTNSKQLLGRTPTKLYSPFGIESPYKSTTIDKENIKVNETNIIKLSEV